MAPPAATECLGWGISHVDNGRHPH